ncbi:MAG: hypothetical protein ACYDG6_14430, partial [Thermincolia bacterium]
DAITKSIVAPSYRPEEGHAGLTYYSGNKKLHYEEMEKVGPVGAVVYEGRIFSNTALLMKVNNVTGTEVTEFGLKEKKFNWRIPVSGYIENLHQVGSIVYFVSYVSEKSLSNIYKYDFTTRKLEKILKNDRHWLPERLAFDTNSQILYGLYTEAWKEGVEEQEANQIVNIEKGEIKSMAFIPPNAAEMLIADGKLFILHIDERGIPVEQPIGVFDTKTKEYTPLPIKVGFARTMWIKGEQLFVSDFADKTVKVFRLGTWEQEQVINPGERTITIR